MAFEGLLKDFTVSIQVVFKGFRPAAAAEPRVQRGLSFELPLRVWFLIAIVGCEIQSPYNHERLELGLVNRNGKCNCVRERSGLSGLRVWINAIFS